MKRHLPNLAIGKLEHVGKMMKTAPDCSRKSRVVHVSMSQSKDSNAFHGSVFGPGVTARLGDGTGPTSQRSREC